MRASVASKLTLLDPLTWLPPPVTIAAEPTAVFAWQVWQLALSVDPLTCHWWLMEPLLTPMTGAVLSAWQSWQVAVGTVTLDQGTAVVTWFPVIGLPVEWQ